MLVMHWHRDGQGRLVAGWNQEDTTRYRMQWNQEPVVTPPQRKDKKTFRSAHPLTAPALLAACGRALLHRTH